MCSSRGCSQPTSPTPPVLEGRFYITSTIWGTPIQYMSSFPCNSVGKESACSAGDLDLIPGLGRSPGEGNGNHSSILAWKIPWTEEPGGLQSMRSQRVGHD